MSHTSRLWRMPDTFRQLTGITPEAFARLVAELKPQYQQADTARKTRRSRQRKPGAGRKFALPLGDRLLMLLMYYRTYTTHALLGFLFGIDQSSVCRNINPLQPLLAGLFRIPERRVELEPDDIRELFFDATERAIPRPSQGPKRFYSGKKRRHTLKHQVVVVRKRKPPAGPVNGVGCRSPPCRRRSPARPTIRRCTTEPPWCARRGVPRTGDTPYLGTGLCTPRRRPRKGQLPPRQKAGNRRVSRRRIVVEHGIGKMKVRGWPGSVPRVTVPKSGSRRPAGRFTLRTRTYGACRHGSPEVVTAGCH